MASGTGSHPTRISPRKFSEKIALLNKKERETNKKFEEIIKEVQATRQQQPPQQASAQQSIDGSSGLSILQDELRLIGSGASYQAVHAESLEEIEKVYENLMESVGQCDVESQENSLYQRSSQYIGATDMKSTIYQPSNQVPAGKQQPTANASIHAAALPFIPSLSSAFYQQSDNRNPISTTRSDLSGNHQQQQQQRRLIRDSIIIPCDSSAKSNFPGHNQLDICVSASCESPSPQQAHTGQQHLGYMYSNVQPVSNSCRARVVSFGSATRQKYPCATSDLLNQQGGCHSGRHQIYRAENQNYHTQYLKEPSGDRSRQKSCSDPQLHISPNQHIIVNPVVQCSSENRLADHQNQSGAEFGTNEHPHSTMDCCDANPQARSQQLASDTAYKMAYADSNLMVDYKGNKPMIVNNQQPQLVQKANEAPNLDAQSNLIGDLSFCQNLPVEAQGHLYSMCDTTNTRGQLPGIKICTIDDGPTGRVSSMMGRTSRNSNRSNDRTPPSRDGSLPDISNLKFGTNSSNASPEREVVAQKQYQQQQQAHWPQDNMGTSISGTNNPDSTNTSNTLDKFSCQLSGVDWSSYDGPRVNNVEMDVQGSQAQYIQSQRQTSDQVSRVQDEPSRCWQTDSAQQPFAHPSLPKVNNTLSNSDCGFATSPFHQQQGSLMICTSSDFYNNIIRSRSHNNISSINDHSKRGQHYPCNTLHQIEQHHTSQYCLQTDQQPAPMNVRRIAELKACGTSTSPLDSSSNLNSPQSEMNSPGSSTTEQCEAAVMLSGNVAQQQEPRQFSMGSLTNGSSSTLVPDGLQFISQYASAATMPEQGQQQLTEPATFGQDVCNQTHQ